MSVSKLSRDDFQHVVQNAPLVSIDLIVENEVGEYLLGLRKNAPARGYWFVPGGRVYKGETLSTALERTSETELGITVSMAEGRFLGLYEHFYEENALNAPGFGTHYVVAAFWVKYTGKVLPTAQHSDYRWLSAEEILEDPLVHPYTQDYFRADKGIR